MNCKCCGTGHKSSELCPTGWTEGIEAAVEHLRSCSQYGEFHCKDDWLALEYVVAYLTLPPPLSILDILKRFYAAETEAKASN